MIASDVQFGPSTVAASTMASFWHNNAFMNRRNFFFIKSAIILFFYFLLKVQSYSHSARYFDARTFPVWWTAPNSILNILF